MSTIQQIVSNLPENSIQMVHTIQWINVDELNKLKKDNTDMKNQIEELKREKEILYNDMVDKHNLINKHEETINNNKITIEELKKENEELKSKIFILEKDMNDLKNGKKKFDALVKLHECNSLVNKIFKQRYMKEFKKGRGDYMPDIGVFINDPPNVSDSDYLFWEKFKLDFPRSDDLKFRNIYRQINNDRANNGAHVNIRDLTRNEFVDLIKIAYSNEYVTEPKLYDEYTDWIFLFPAI